MPFALGNAHQPEAAPSPTTGHIFGDTMSVSSPSPTTGHIFWGDHINLFPFTHHRSHFWGHHFSPSPCHQKGQIPLNQRAQGPIHLPQHAVFTVIFPLGHPTDAPNASPKISSSTELCCCPTQVIWGLQSSSGPFMCRGRRLVAITELCICLTSQPPQSPPCPLAMLVLLLHF